jgi:hypothetical protein
MEDFVKQENRAAWEGFFTRRECAAAIILLRGKGGIRED